ncbi:MAG: hypothetical protein ACRDT8_17105 [Micromonosporaceae bacterium]
MRVLVTMRLDTEVSSRAIETGTLPKIVESFMEQVHPESAYFGAVRGKRTCYIVFDLEDPSRMPPLLEPLFRELGAEIDVVPVMNKDDLQKGLSEVGR